MRLVGLERSLMLRQREDGLQVWLLGERDLVDFSNAVASVYTSAFDAGAVSVSDIQREDHRLLSCSIFLTICTQERDTIATFRLTQWSDELAVPIQSFFGISISDHASGLDEQPGSVWHGGRLSISKPALVRAGFSKNYSLNILKSIVQYGFEILSHDPTAVVFGEMDTMAIKAVAKIGIRCERLAAPKYYLGSETVPVMIRLQHIQLLPYVAPLKFGHALSA